MEYNDYLYSPSVGAVKNSLENLRNQSYCWAIRMLDNLVLSVTTGASFNEFYSTSKIHTFISIQMRNFHEHFFL